MLVSYEEYHPESVIYSIAKIDGKIKENFLIAPMKEIERDY